ncbi:MAG TPA: zinc ribbon domain-containing protein [Anaerolineaceae bacterium]|jgi:hypothetical protein|nr:zinc ribbon domain-containing protein [Anaerolineaceae bacterium]HOD45624.1 zinc ribbon domain-containing protein [Anaerolineaceae bacterium]HQO96222.1 zinc ribbon domain-containing protein [Anaerolineaceae bacterium]
MDAGSLFLVLAFFIVVILFVSRPFFNRTLAAQRLMQKKASSTMDHQRSALLAEQDRILQSLHELDADHATGKVLDEDYAHQRTSLLQAGADVLRNLDQLNGAVGGDLAGTTGVADGKTPDIDNPQLARRLEERRKNRQNSSTGGFCPKCGQAVSKGDQFCSKCGHLLK